MKVFDKKFNNKKVKNKATGVTINLRKKGAKHALFARTGQFEKIVCVTLIDEIIKQAVLEGIETGKSEGIIGVLRFKTKIKIDLNLFIVIIVVRVTKEGKMYYDHILFKK